MRAGRKSPMPERGKGGWHEVCAGIARRLGWQVWHDRSRGVNDPDEPDLRLLRERLVLVELKGTGARLEKGQKERLLAYAKAGVEVYAWWPEDVDKAIAVLGYRCPLTRPQGACYEQIAAMPVKGDGRRRNEHHHG